MQNILPPSSAAFIRNARKSLWLPVTSGILLTLALPMFGVWQFIWVALVPIVLFLDDPGLSLRRIIAGITLTMFPYAFFVIFPLFSISSSWFASGINLFDVGVLGRMLFFPVIALIAGGGGALFSFPFFLTVRRLRRSTGGVVCAALFWVILETIRSTYLLSGFSWGVFGYALIDMPHIRSAGYLPGGVLVLSFLVVLTNLSLAELVDTFCQIRTIHPKDADAERRTSVVRSYPATSVSVFCLLLLPFLGSTLFHGQHCLAHPLRVAVIPSTLTTAESMDPSTYPYFKNRMVSALNNNATLLLLPENALPFFEPDESTLRSGIFDAAQSQNTNTFGADLFSLSRSHPTSTIAVGLHTTNRYSRYNSLVLLKDGSVEAIYHKRLLVPFAEYTPFFARGWLPNFEHLTGGTDSRPLVFSGGVARGLICSEVGSLSSLTDNSADIILSPSNDSVFSSANVADVHHIFSRMRAMESGAYLLRASKGGISSIIAPDGTVLASGTAGVLFADIPTCK